MAEHQSGGKVSFADKMDYSEHDRTYALFLKLVKIGSIWVVAILIGMLVGLITSAGLLAGVLAFVVSGTVATYLMK